MEKINMEVKESDVISYISFVLNRYNKEHKLLDQVGCEELVKSLILYNDLSNYIHDVKIVPSNNVFANMSYSYFNKTINITPDFIKGIKRQSKKTLDFFKIHDEIVSTNIDILHALLHEVMHAKQYKILDTSDDELLKTILLKSLAAATYEESEDKDKALEFAKVSTNTNIYQLMPSELNAEIEAYKQTKEIINHLYLDHKYKYYNMYDLSIKLLEIHTYEKGFFGIKSPVEKFIKLRNKYLKDEILLSKKDIFKYDLKTRLSYGLPITKREYADLQSEITSDMKAYVNM
jgi:hypothetical protein